MFNTLGATAARPAHQFLIPPLGATAASPAHRYHSGRRPPRAGTALRVGAEDGQGGAPEAGEEALAGQGPGHPPRGSPVGVGGFSHSCLFVFFLLYIIHFMGGDRYN